MTLFICLLHVVDEASTFSLPNTVLCTIALSQLHNALSYPDKSIVVEECSA